MNQKIYNYPEYTLKSEYKNRILRDPLLMGVICDFFSIHPNTLRRWINEDALTLLNFNLLNILWAETGVEKLTQLLEIKKK